MRRRELTRSLLLATLLVGCDRIPSTPGGEQPADTGKWTRPEHVPANVGAVAGNPRLIAGNGTLYLAFDGQSGGFPTDVYVMERRTGGWTAPVNLSRSMSPSSAPAIALDSRGVIHALWGERTHSPTPRPGGAPTDIFYTANQSGSWAAPQRLYHSKSEGLHLPHSPVVDANGDVHVVFSARVEGAQPPVLYLRRSAGAWGEPRTIGVGGVPDLAVDGAGRLLVAYIAPDTLGARESGFDQNSVFFTHSGDGGRTWAARTLVSRSGRNPANDPRIVVAGDGRIHVFWTKDRTGDLSPEEVWHSVSSDGGARWSAPANIAPSLGGVPRSIQAVADRSGRVHAAIHLASGSGPLGSPPFRPYYLHWNGTSWSAPEHLFGSNAASRLIGLAVDGSDTLHVVLGASDLGSGAGLYHASRSVR